MPTAADLCELLDRLARDAQTQSSTEAGWDVYRAAVAHGLVPEGEIGTVARWVGELVNDERLTYRASQGGTPPTPPGRLWGDRELQQHISYQLTTAGRADAQTSRRARRDAHASGAVSTRLAISTDAPLTQPAREALQQHAAALELSLQEQRHAATLGAAKDLVESAAKGVLAYVGSTPGKTDSLGPLYRAALEAVRPEDEPPPDSWSVARGLVAVVAGLAQLRNTAGSGHGRAEPSLAKAQDADLAAASATAAVRYLLAPH